MFEEKLRTLQDAVAAIERRNKRVEADKAWELSQTRTLLIACITYIVAALVLFIVGTPHHLLGALVPAIGFYLSVRPLSLLKRWWTRKYLLSREQQHRRS